jgi:hypothetical protein
VLVSVCAWAQEDEDNTEPKKRLFDINDIYHQAINSIKKTPEDSVKAKKMLKVKSEAPFLKYEGRIIRHITVNQYGFEKKFVDTTSRSTQLGTQLLNKLHTTSREWVIRNNIFFKKNEPLNAYVVADNERFLRSLNFIQDVRIIVKPVRKSHDSVDIEIITKDLFSITGILDFSGFQHVKGRIADVNFMGMGQTVQFTSVADKDRSPFAGYEWLYSKQNVAHSFVDATIAYSTVNSGTNGEEETAYYLRLDRPLISPYTHTAGGLLLSHNEALNNYGVPDMKFLKYRYNIYDIWLGYNIGCEQLLKCKNTNRNRTFVSARYLKYGYTITPTQIGTHFDPVYNSREAALGQITFFRQDYYKTNYIYGFGSTEDYPTGYKVSGTAGWHKQLDLERPYAGVEGDRYVATKKGEFLQYFIKAGGFYHKGKLQDAALLMGVNAFGKLWVLDNGLKVRQNVKLSYTRLWDMVTYPPLRIDNGLGIYDFHKDSLYGDTRMTLYAETIVFLQKKILGFHFAPFAFVNLSGLTPPTMGLNKTDLYSGFGGGVRTRNENLVFGTIELKISYFPRDATQPFKININSDIRYKYTSNYVSAPDVIQLNADVN